MPITTGVISGGLSGALNQLVVFKRYGNKTVVTRYPNMSGIKPSAEQKKQRGLFAEAVAYAKIINDNPELKAQYKKKVKRRQTVFNYAVKEYMRNPAVRNHGEPGK